MRKLIFASFILSTFLSSCCNSTKEVKNTNDHLIMASLWYQRSSECRALYYQAFNMAKLSLDKQLQNLPKTVKKAVVVDIDETVLDNSPFEAHLIRTGENFSKKAWTEWTDKASAKATPGSLEFLNYAKSKGVETFYISNRDSSACSRTLENLQKLGFPFADSEHLFLKTTTSVKTERRNAVLETHEILVLAGDNLGDFDEFFEGRSTNYGFAQADSMKHEFGNRFIVLPNPMYGSWEKEILKSDRKQSPAEKQIVRKKKLIGYEEM